MKLWLTLSGIALLAVAAVMILPRSRSEAQPKPEDTKAPARTVTASGTGSVTTTADVVRISVNVKSVAATSQEATDENDKKVKKLDRAIQDLNIPNLKTMVLSAGCNKTPPPQATQPGGPPMGGPMPPMGAPPPMGPGKQPDTYSAAHTLEIVVKGDDTAKLVEAADRIAKALRANGLADLSLNYTMANYAGSSNGYPFRGGGLQFGGGYGLGGGNATGVADNSASVVFVREDTTDLRRKALTKAVETALGNARAMTDGGKVRLLDVTSISDRTMYGPFAGSSLNVTANHPTDIEISVDVTVTCSVKD